jgi:hypothetical protein
MNDLETLWREHQDADFPPRCRGREIDGIDLVMLDADIVGCVDRFISGQLDVQYAAILGRCYRDVTLVVRQLRDAEEQVYFGRLERLAAAVLEALSFVRPRQN